MFTLIPLGGTTYEEWTRQSACTDAGPERNRHVYHNPNGIKQNLTGLTKILENFN